MVASLDGYIARTDGSVDWLETSDKFDGGGSLAPGFVEAFLETIDCYVMGSRTYETALRFEAQGFGWSYEDKPTFVLSSRDLPRTRDTVEFYSGDLAQFVNEQLRPRFRSIWFVGGGMVAAECLRSGPADEVRYSILPILIGNGIWFFEKLEHRASSGRNQSLQERHGGTSLRGATRGATGRVTKHHLTTAAVLLAPAGEKLMLYNRSVPPCAVIPELHCEHARLAGARILRDGAVRMQSS